MANQDNKPVSNLYPFQTKREILALLAADEGFRNECVKIINDRQTAVEQETLSTRVRNRGGWASSDAVRLGKVARKLAALEQLSPEDQALVSLRIPSYVKQLAANFRAEALENQPELAESAKAFFSQGL